MIVDERAVYHGTNGFLTRDGFRVGPAGGVAAESGRRRQVRQADVIGALGFTSGPDLIIIDTNALTDPLLSRLPPASSSFHRPGHLARAIPAGYLESRVSGRNQIRDAEVARYFDLVRAVSQDPVASPDRWRAMVSLLTQPPPRAEGRPRQPGR